jgi:hypothetical protein
LQAGEAGEAQMLGEADERRRLHPRRCGDARSRAEGDLVGIVEGIGGNLRNAFRQRLPAFEDQRAQRVVVARRLLLDRLLHIAHAPAFSG